MDFDAHLFLDAPLSRYFNMVTRIGRGILKRNEKKFAYCDEVAVGVAIDPDNLIKESKMLNASVELRGELTRGQLAIDWTANIYCDIENHPGILKGRRMVRFITKYDVPLLDKMIFETVLRSSEDHLKN